MRNVIALGLVAFVASMILSAVAFAQTATPSPSPTTTVPTSAPATGRG